MEDLGETLADKIRTCTGACIESGETLYFIVESGEHRFKVIVQLVAKTVGGEE